MNSPLPESPHPPRPPVHLWLVGILLLLWNCWGLFGSIAAQVDLVPDMPADASAYFDRQPLWFMVFADLSPLAGVAGSLALLVQSRLAPALYLAQIAVLAIANSYEVVIGTSLLLTNRWALMSTLFLLAILIGQVLYARHLLRRGILT
jgi:hypothetical protein